MGPDSNVGCSKCWKQVYNNHGNFADDGVFLENTRRRTHAEHARFAEEWKILLNATQQQKHSKEHGSRWSHLLRLPYYDCIRFLSIDPMHCWFTNIVKHTLDTMILYNIFTLKELSDACAAVQLPRHMGRLVASYEDKMRKLTGEELMRFALHMSDPVMKNIIKNPEAARMWSHLTEALREAASFIVHPSDLEQSSRHLYEFLVLFEKLFGKKECRPNFHLAQELIKECIPDYGPAHVTWCFAFERLNGLLGSTPHNNRDIQGTLMRTFLNGQTIPQDSFLGDPQFTPMWAHIQKSYVPAAVLEVEKELAKLNPQQKYDLYLSHGKAHTFGGWEPYPAVLISSRSADVTSKKFKRFDVVMLSILRTRFAGRAEVDTTISTEVRNEYHFSSTQALVLTTNIGSVKHNTKGSFILSKFEEHEYAGQVQKYYEVLVQLHNKLTGKTEEVRVPMAYVRWYTLLHREPRKVRVQGTKRTAQGTAISPDLHFKYDDLVFDAAFVDPPDLSETARIHEGRDNWVPLQEISATFAPVYLTNPEEISRLRGLKPFRVARYPLAWYV